MTKTHENLLIRFIFLIIGLSSGTLVTFFLATGYDEIWNGYTVSWYGVAIAVILSIYSITSLVIALKPRKTK